MMLKNPGINPGFSYSLLGALASPLSCFHVDRLSAGAVFILDFCFDQSEMSLGFFPVRKAAYVEIQAPGFNV